jgi:AraC family ethanolamine operon transcriptional activator
VGAAPVRLFQSSSELEALLGELGFEPRVVQIQAGPLQGRFQFSPAGQGAVVRFKASAGFTLVCPRKTQILPLGLNREGSKGRIVVHGQPVAEHGIAGCYVGLPYSFFQVWPGADALLALLPRQPLLEGLALGSAQNCLQWMNDCNQLQLTPQAHRAMAELFLAALEPSASKPIDLLRGVLELMNDQALVAPVRFKKPTRHELVAQLMVLGAQLIGPLNLDAVVEQLGCSRRSLIQGCTELLGIGPIELLRAQRLERVHQALLAGSQESAPSPALVGEIAQRFGFRSRGHFAAAYQEQYGQSPSQTLNQAA